jgi:hypothetical protein
MASLVAILAVVLQSAFEAWSLHQNLQHFVATHCAKYKAHGICKLYGKQAYTICTGILSCIAGKDTDFLIPSGELPTYDTMQLG